MTQTVYDSFAQNWDQTRQKPWPEFDVLLPLIGKHERWLDMGCGNGRLRASIDTELIRPGDYYGFDLSQSLVKIARQRSPKDHFFTGDFTQSLPFGADQFHGIASIASFHHILSKSQQLDHLAELYRITRPGGVVFMTTWILPQKHFWSNFWSGRYFTKNWLIPFGNDKHPRYYRQVTLRDLRKLARKTGFVVKKEMVFSGRNRVMVLEKPA